MAYSFSSKTEEKFQWLLTRYPTRQAVLIPLLHLVQEDVGYLSAEVVDCVAERVGISPAKVKEVASFYTMFRFEKKGTYVLQFCHNLSCYLRGSDELLDRAKAALSIEEGATTPDGKFTIERAECLGSCGTAPVMQVNVWDFMEELDVEKLDKVLELLKNDKAACASYKERIEQGGVA